MSPGAGQMSPKHQEYHLGSNLDQQPSCCLPGLRPWALEQPWSASWGSRMLRTLLE